MTSVPKVLILGGTGKIGSAVALDLLQHTSAILVLTGRSPRWPSMVSDWIASSGDARGDRVQLLALDLGEVSALEQAIAAADLVIHCAGPFRDRNLTVLETCIQKGIPYLDVSDSPDYVRQALALRSQAKTAGVTAIVSTGVFPGLSNSMVRLAVEQVQAEPIEHIDRIQLNYVVAGSGGAGKTVMRTTFLEIQHPFQGWLDRQWQNLQPYSAPELASFQPPYGTVPVYWFSTSEAATLAKSFDASNVITKFGSLPRFYNALTALMTRGVFGQLLKNRSIIEFLAQVSYAMTQVSDHFSGVGLAMQAQVIGTPTSGLQTGKTVTYQVDFCHDNTAIAAGMGTGSVAADILAGRLCKPGVWPVEQGVPTDLFLQAIAQRNLSITQKWVTLK